MSEPANLILAKALAPALDSALEETLNLALMADDDEAKHRIGILCDAVTALQQEVHRVLLSHLDGPSEPTNDAS